MRWPLKALGRALFALFAMSWLAACSTQAPTAQHNVLIFSHSTGYRHASIEPGVTMLQAIGAREGYHVTASEDPDIFTPDRLAEFDAIVLLSNSSRRTDTSSEWFAGARGEALQAYVRGGGGVVGIHAAADSHYNWPWYRKMIGAAFDHHPPGTPEGVVTIREGGETRAVTRTDEWYYYVDFDPNVELLATYDPVSIGQAGPGPNPIAWRHEFEGGRVFYTGLGHTTESYKEPFFIDHVTKGLRWALERGD